MELHTRKIPAKKLTNEDKIELSNKLMKNLIAMTWIDPNLKELLRGVTLQICVVEVSSTSSVPADEFVKEPASEVKLEIKELPRGYGSKTHYILATFPNGERREMSQHKNISAALKAKRRLDRHGIALDLLLNPSGGLHYAEEEA